MGSETHAARVGGLAVALGVGAALATGQAVAAAHTGTSPASDSAPDSGADSARSTDTAKNTRNLPGQKPGKSSTGSRADTTADSATDPDRRADVPVTGVDADADGDATAVTPRRGAKVTGLPRLSDIKLPGMDTAPTRSRPVTRSPGFDGADIAKSVARDTTPSLVSAAEAPSNAPAALMSTSAPVTPAGKSAAQTAQAASPSATPTATVVTDLLGWLGLKPAAPAPTDPGSPESPASPLEFLFAAWRRTTEPTPVNKTPTFAAQSSTVTLNKGQSTPITVNGQDADGDPLDYTVGGAKTGTGSAGGTVTITDGTATYTPPAGWDGKTKFTETFTVTASDEGGEPHNHALPSLLQTLALGLIGNQGGNTGHTATATLSVTVNPVSAPPPPPPPPPAQNAVDCACAGDLNYSDGGRISDAELTEISGIDAGIANTNLYWVHNDSGDGPRIFAIDSTGTTVGTYTLDDADARDWEDISVGPGPVAGQSYIYAGDIGDNGRLRDEIVVYRVAEPKVDGNAGDQTLKNVDTLRLKYPDGAHNAEAMMVDPQTGDIIIIEKTSGGGTAKVYRAPGGLQDGSVTTLQQVGTVRLPSGSGNVVTGADVSPDGKQVAVRTYNQVLLWSRDPASGVWTAFAADPCEGEDPDESQGEAIAFHSDGKGYVTISEGSNQVLHHADA